MERNKEVARSDSRKRGDAGWWSAGQGKITGGSMRDEAVGKPGDKGYLGVAMSAGDMYNDGPPPYNRAMQILREKA